MTPVLLHFSENFAISLRKALPVPLPYGPFWAWNPIRMVVSSVPWLGTGKFKLFCVGHWGNFSSNGDNRNGDIMCKKNTGCICGIIIWKDLWPKVAVSPSRWSWEFAMIVAFSGGQKSSSLSPNEMCVFLQIRWNFRKGSLQNEPRIHHLRIFQTAWKSPKSKR